jgi:hypothetical protein
MVWSEHRAQRFLKEAVLVLHRRHEEVKPALETRSKAAGANKKHHEFGFINRLDLFQR